MIEYIQNIRAQLEVKEFRAEQRIKRGEGVFTRMHWKVRVQRNCGNVSK